MKGTIALLLLISIAGFACASCSSARGRTDSTSEAPVISEPATRIDIEREGDALVFQFGLCDEAELGTATSYVSVTDKQHTFCQAEREPVEPLVQRWHYGSSENGFRVKNCKPLLPLGKYTICSMGGGGGCTKFELDASGDPHLLENACGLKK